MNRGPFSNFRSTNPKTRSIEDVSVRWATIYLSLNMEPHEIMRAGLQELVPKCTNKGGRPHSVLTITEDEKWEIIEQEII